MDNIYTHRLVKRFCFGMFVMMAGCVLSNFVGYIVLCSVFLCLMIGLLPIILHKYPATGY